MQKTTGSAVNELITALQEKDGEIHRLIAERKELLEEIELHRKSEARLSERLEKLEELWYRRELRDAAMTRLFAEVGYAGHKKNEVRDIVRDNMNFAVKYQQVREFLHLLVLDSRDSDRRERLFNELDSE